VAAAEQQRAKPSPTAADREALQAKLRQGLGARAQARARARN
jgi:hypothetical protein